MFALAILVGIYSYLIFALGVLDLLYPSYIIIITILYIIFSLFYFKKNTSELPKITIRNKKIRPYILLFCILAGINLIGALGPELSFDALWYHLTLPKIFLMNHSISFLSGGLFYYSVMPKLGEMLYIPAVMIGAETIAKLTQWSFGILISVAVYKISRKYFDEKTSFFAVIIFYGSLVVAWESTVAYIDLIRTFFEIMGLWGILIWFETKDRKWLIESGVMVGLAISTKLIALGSIPIFIALIMIFEKDKSAVLKNSIIFGAVSLIVALPWFFFAYLSTGNPFFPVFSEVYNLNIGSGLMGLAGVKDLLVLFLRSADPISPIYIILFPLIFVYFKKLKKEIQIIAVYSLFAIIIWYLTPHNGGGRFILPYLPAFSILSVTLIEQIKTTQLKKYMYAVILLVFISTIMYRGVATLRFLPAVLGHESKEEFLTKNLNFDFGDFYDTDGFFENIKSDDMVLLFGFHNLYYAEFPFIHESFARTGDRFNFIATQNSELPSKYSHWKLIYANKKTHVNVYSLGGAKWSY